MLSIEKCRQILGKEYQHLNDEEIKKLRDWMYFMAELAINAVEKSNNKN